MTVKKKILIFIVMAVMLATVAVFLISYFNKSDKKTFDENNVGEIKQNRNT